MDDQAKTICALLTPHGRGAVAVVAISGSGIEQVLDSQFKAANGKAYSAQRGRKIVYGVWNSTGEDLIIFRRSTEPCESVEYEIHCHGGSMASQAIIGDLTAAGVEQVNPERYLNRTAESSIESFWKSEILIAISKATTNRTAELLLRQLTIGPGSMAEIAEEIKNFRFESALEKIKSIHAWADLGSQLTQPRIVVFCGHPNVGKSSLVNAIVGFQRAIVNEVAGTTRDVVSQSTAIAGWPVELRDTAGLRESKNVIETIGIEKARNEINTADLKICVFDIAKDWGAEDQELVDSIEPGLIVLNKSDLAAESEIQHRLGRTPSAITTSVESGKGIESLIEKMGELLNFDLPDPTQAIPVSVEQAARLENAAAALSTYLSIPQNQRESEHQQSVASQVLQCLVGQPGTIQARSASE